MFHSRRPCLRHNSGVSTSRSLMATLLFYPRPLVSSIRAPPSFISPRVSHWLRTIQTLTICSSRNPVDAFQQYQSLTGATMDSNTGLLTITPAQYANLQTLSFNIGGTTYGLIPNAQIWPRSLNGVTGGNSSSIYLVVGDIGSPSGTGLDFVNGYTFLYVIS